jgi:hypothetical protein
MIASARLHIVRNETALSHIVPRHFHQNMIDLFRLGKILAHDISLIYKK